jgi:hypothetical protein
MIASPPTRRTDRRMSAASKDEMLEHVLRITGDELSVLSFRDAPPGSMQAYAALGMLSRHTSAVIAPGTPLHSWCTGGAVVETWREQVGSAAESLWNELETLTALFGPVKLNDPYLRLERLRELAEEATELR